MDRDEMFIEEMVEESEQLPKWLHGLYYLMFVVQGLILIHLIIG
jgi:hypothetical protein